jgi:hypothetical protein
MVVTAPTGADSVRKSSACADPCIDAGAKPNANTAIDNKNVRVRPPSIQPTPKFLGIIRRQGLGAVNPLVNY